MGWGTQKETYCYKNSLFVAYVHTPALTHHTNLAHTRSSEHTIWGPGRNAELLLHFCHGTSTMFTDKQA